MRQTGVATSLAAALLALGSAFLASPSLAEAATQPAWFGASGPHVAELQGFLSERGLLDHVATGYYGPLTLAAVKAWQSASGVPSTGYYGPLSIAAAARQIGLVGQAGELVPVTLSASVPSDSDDVASVQYFVDGAPYGEPVTAAPFSAVARLVPGEHSVYVRITYVDGFVITRRAVPVTVAASSEAGAPVARVVPVRVRSGSRGGSSDEAPPAVSVQVSPASATVDPFATSTFVAVVENAGQAVTWSADGGSISASGVFTAPSPAATTTYTVTATSDEDVGASASATVTVPPIVVALSPSATTTLGGTNVTLTASVANATTSDVTWSADGGSISASGVFTAPGVSATTTYTVTASSTVDSSRAATATVEVTPDEDFVGWWKLDEGADTTAYDSSGQGNHGTWSGTASGDAGYYHTDGAPGFAYSGSFSTGDDKVTVTNIDIGEARTITFWAYIPNLDGTEELISKSSSGQGVEVIIHGGTIHFYVMGSSVQNAFASAGDITLNDWNYITATYDGPSSTMTVYINGQQSGTTGTAPGTIGIVDALRFGDWADDNRDFEGRLNDIRMYTTLYTAQEVEDLYESF